MLGWRMAFAARASLRKRLQQLRVAAQLGPQHLDRHLAPDLGVLGQVHRAHAALAEQGHRPVIPETRALHHRRHYRPKPPPPFIDRSKESGPLDRSRTHPPAPPTPPASTPHIPPAHESPKFSSARLGPCSVRERVIAALLHLPAGGATPPGPHPYPLPQTGEGERAALGRILVTCPSLTCRSLRPLFTSPVCGRGRRVCATGEGSGVPDARGGPSAGGGREFRPGGEIGGWGRGGCR